MADRTDGSPTSVAAVPEIARLPQSPSTSALPSPPVVGDVVYVFAFDVAYDMTRSPVLELLGQPVEQYVVDPSKRNPRHMTFYRPRMVRLAPVEKQCSLGRLRLERSIKLLPVGAISITIRVPFAVKSLDDLVPFHDLRFDEGANGDARLADDVRQLAEQVKAELRSHYIRPLERIGFEEAYTVFCIASGLTIPGEKSCSAEQWLRANRRSVASLLTEE